MCIMSIIRSQDANENIINNTEESLNNMDLSEGRWEKDVWEFQAESGSSGSCCLFLYFLGKTAVQDMSGRTPGSPRHPSCRHPRPSEPHCFNINNIVAAFKHIGEKIMDSAEFTV